MHVNKIEMNWQALARGAVRTHFPVKNSAMALVSEDTYDWRRLVRHFVKLQIRCVQFAVAFVEFNLWKLIQFIDQHQAVNQLF